MIIKKSFKNDIFLGTDNCTFYYVHKILIDTEAEVLELYTIDEQIGNIYYSKEKEVFFYKYDDNDRLSDNVNILVKNGKIVNELFTE